VYKNNIYDEFQNGINKVNINHYTFFKSRIISLYFYISKSNQKCKFNKIYNIVIINEYILYNIHSYIVLNESRYSYELHLFIYANNTTNIYTFNRYGVELQF